MVMIIIGNKRFRKVVHCSKTGGSPLGRIFGSYSPFQTTLEKKKATQQFQPLDVGQVRSHQVLPATTVRQPAKCVRQQDVWPNTHTHTHTQNTENRFRLRWNLDAQKGDQEEASAGQGK